MTKVRQWHIADLPGLAAERRLNHQTRTFASLGDHNSFIPRQQANAAHREKLETLEKENEALEERATAAEKFGENTLGELAEAERRAEGLEGQLRNLERKLDGLGKGTDHPACWLSRTRKSEYIFDVTLTSRGIITHDNALPHRTAEQAQLPLQTIVFDQEVQPEQFLKMSRPVFEWSKRKGCRFFVRLSDRTKADQKTIYKQLYRTVEQRFYPFEVRNGAF